MTVRASDGTRFFLHVASFAQVVICFDQVHRAFAFSQVALRTLRIFRGSCHLLAVLIEMVANAAILDPGFGVVLVVIKRYGGAGEPSKCRVINFFDIFLGKTGKGDQNGCRQHSGQAYKSK